MAFGVETPKNLAIACGVVTAFFGGIMIAINFKWPELFDKPEKYRP
jgi:uncharacterized membrane protein YeiH